MTPQSKSRERRDGERHTTHRPTKDDEQVSAGPSHRDVTQRVRDADRFALQLPMVGRVPIPRPDQLAFYGALAGLVAVELVDWPVAVAIGVGHALISGRTEQIPGNKGSQPE
jgi:hypothetical protein